LNRFEVEDTKLAGLKRVRRSRLGDDRGFLARLFCADELRDAGWNAPLAQVNHTRTARRGSVRGLHFQHPPRAEKKLVHCLRGEVFDVAVDLRRGSPTYGQWEGYVLDDETHRQLFVPAGFGHGFAVLSEIADVAYLLSSVYDPDTEAGIAWDDPDVGVEWPVSDPLLSERDKSAPRLAEVADSLPFSI
jgi:dTDP-4-dehydrorhamnose 3,5-epimerase